MFERNTYVPKFKNPNVDYKKMSKGSEIMYDFDSCHCSPFCEEHDDSAFYCPEECENYVDENFHYCSDYDDGVGMLEDFCYFLESVADELNNFYLYECGFAREESKWHSLVRNKDSNGGYLSVDSFIISGFSDDDEDDNEDLRDAFIFLDNNRHSKRERVFGVPLPAFWHEFVNHFGIQGYSGRVCFERSMKDDACCYVLSCNGDSVYFVNPHFLRSDRHQVSKFYEFRELYWFFSENSVSSIDDLRYKISNQRYGFPFRIQLLASNIEKDSLLAESISTDVSLEQLSNLFVDAIIGVYLKDWQYTIDDLDLDDFFVDKDEMEDFPCIIRVLSLFLDKLYKGLIRVKPEDSLKVHYGAEYPSSSVPFVLEHKYFRVFYTPYYQGFSDRELSCFSPFLARLKDDLLFSFDFSDEDVCLVDSEIWNTEKDYY